ncbi:PH domain-containing protein [uncultured Microbacterium sp.]|uniref:PH domain-containing protein n=1 Tax=uncultured Microbacterium sp. TaxID=191216 RepID=UPI0035CB03F6
MSDTGEIVLHSRFNRIMAIVCWVAAALILIAAATSVDLRFVWIYPAAALIAFLAWVALWRPYVGVDDDGVTLQNVSHRVLVPWPALIHVDTRYALTLHTPGQKFVAWAAPAPGALSSAVAGRRAVNREAKAAGAVLRPGDLLGTESGDAATVVREQWQRRVESNSIPAGMADDIAVTRDWNITAGAVVAVLIVATGWALATTA